MSTARDGQAVGGVGGVGAGGQAAAAGPCALEAARARHLPPPGPHLHPPRHLPTHSPSPSQGLHPPHHQPTWEEVQRDKRVCRHGQLAHTKLGQHARRLQVGRHGRQQRGGAVAQLRQAPQHPAGRRARSQAATCQAGASHREESRATPAWREGTAAEAALDAPAPPVPHPTIPTWPRPQETSPPPAPAAERPQPAAAAGRRAAAAHTPTPRCSACRWESPASLPATSCCCSQCRCLLLLTAAPRQSW